MPSAADWEARYARGEHQCDAPFSFVAELAARSEKGSALDLACGSGRHAVVLAEAGWSVTGVDASPAALALLAAKAPGVRTVAADLEKGEFLIEAAAWDLILVSFYLQRDLFPAIRNGVARGGRVALAFPIEDAREGVRPMNPAYLVQPEELRAVFEGWLVEHERVVCPEAPGRARIEFVAVRPRI